MKVSQFLHEYQLTGRVPNPPDSMCAFWSGWLIGNGMRGRVQTDPEERLEMAIKAAEYIEAAR